MRDSRSLNGKWQFQPDPDGQLTLGDFTPSHIIPVPMPWQAAFPEMQQYGGWAWYLHEFDVEQIQGELLLQFGAVDYWCEVFVNGQRVGEHEGGYTPFGFAIGQYVQAGKNTLAVHVYDPVQTGGETPRWSMTEDGSETQPPFNARHIPHGKQEWYINVGGIWQDVRLISVSPTYIEQVHVTPDIQTGEAHIEIRIANSQHGTLRALIDGVHAEITLQPNQTDYTVRLHVTKPNLWTPESPFLYTATVTLQDDQENRENDELAVRFGFREIAARDGKLYLNGEPLYLLSALDQDFYPETIYTVPSDDYLRDQFHKAKALGLNSLRCHIKPPDPRYLDLADEIGLLIWAEIPSWRTFHIKTHTHPASVNLNSAIKARVQTTLEEMIARDYNHPSLIIWTIVNEDWGTALFLSPSDRAWVVEMVEMCKRLDPTRLVVDNSPCPAPWGLSTHVKTDIDDFHVYTNIPDAAESFEQFIEQFGNRPLWSFSNEGDAQRTGSEPIILSEFGNWGLPTLAALAENGKEPDWFDLGSWWAGWEGEPSYPKGVDERFKRLGLNAIWKDYDTFAIATQWHQYNAMKFEIEAMRRQPNIVGYVITEFTDTYWESNGLLDFNRCEKVYHSKMAAFNAPDVVIPYIHRFAYWDDETARITLYASHYSHSDWTSAQLKVTNGEYPVPEMASGEVKRLGTYRHRLSSVSKAEMQTVNFQIENGHPIATSDLSLLVMPSQWRKAHYQQPIAVMSRLDASDDTLDDFAPLQATETLPQQTALPAQELPQTIQLERLLSHLGYQVQPKLSTAAQVLVTDTPSAEMLDWVRAGGDMLYLCSGSSPFFWYQSRGGAYSGNWMTSFSWLRPGTYKRLSIENPLGLAFKGVTPLGTFVGLPVEDSRYQQDFLAGQITGWVGHPAIHTVQFRYGKGRVIATTFNLRKTLADHPVSVVMLHDLIDHLTTNCQPTLTANY